MRYVIRNIGNFDVYIAVYIMRLLFYPFLNCSSEFATTNYRQSSNFFLVKESQTCTKIWISSLSCFTLQLCYSSGILSRYKYLQIRWTAARKFPNICCILSIMIKQVVNRPNNPKVLQDSRSKGLIALSTKFLGRGGA